MPRNRSTRKAAAVTPAGQRPFTTSTGATVMLLPYRQLDTSMVEDSVRQAWADAGRALPAKPTYTLTAAGGVVETHEHDEITIKGNPEATAAWAEWQAAQADFDADLADSNIRNFIIECMAFTPDPRWLAKARAKRLRVPDDEYEAKVFWAKAEIFTEPQDITEAFAASIELAGVTGPQLEAVREAFRRSLAKPAGAAAGNAGG